MKLYNFSHPLNKDAKRVLREQYGVTEIAYIPFHLDTARPIGPQMRNVLKQAGISLPPPSPLAVILPGYAPAAAVLACWFSTATFIRLAAEPGTTPPKWMPVEAFNPLEV